MFDKDHSGAIDYNEFADLWSYVIEWQTCFREYDTDQSGAIDEDELRHALTSFGNYGINSYILHRTFQVRGCIVWFCSHFQ